MALPNVGRRRGMNQDEPHLLRDRSEGVPHHLEGHRVERHTRSTRIAPDWWTVPRHPDSMIDVALRPARIAGPARVTPAASPSTRQSAAAPRLVPRRKTTARRPRDLAERGLVPELPGSLA